MYFIIFLTPWINSTLVSNSAVSAIVCFVCRTFFKLYCYNIFDAYIFILQDILIIFRFYCYICDHFKYWSFWIRIFSFKDRLASEVCSMKVKNMNDSMFLMSSLLYFKSYSWYFVHNFSLILIFLFPGNPVASFCLHLQLCHTQLTMPFERLWMKALMVLYLWSQFVELSRREFARVLDCYGSGVSHTRNIGKRKQLRKSQGWR